MSRALGVVVSVGALSWIAVAAVRRYAIRRSVLDHPTERSSHSVPTPRGGGAGMVAAAIVGYVVFAGPTLNWRTSLALIAVGPTAIVGWLDDHGSLPVLPRLSAHVVSALLLLPLALGPGNSAASGALLSVAWLVATVSAINVVNFMDGIDGLIGLQAALFGFHLTLASGPESPEGMFGLALAAAAIGFLFWNWPRARIFMGDVGSGSAAVLGVIGGILVWRTGRWPFVMVYLPLLPIFLDAAVTIVRRAHRGERLSDAHRSHLYQRLANDASWGHARVTLIYGAAAAVGIVIAIASPSNARGAATVAYAVAVVLLGYLLDRASRRVVKESHS